MFAIAINCYDQKEISSIFPSKEFSNHPPYSYMRLLSTPIFAGLPVLKNKRPNLVISSYAKGQILKMKKGHKKAKFSSKIFKNN